MRGSLDHFLCIHNFSILTRVLNIILPALSTIDEYICPLQPGRPKTNEEMRPTIGESYRPYCYGSFIRDNCHTGFLLR